MKSRSWKNVSGTFITEIEIEGELRELEIDFLSSGYYSPGSMYGGPHGLGEPPDEHEDREFDAARIDGVSLTREQGEKYFNDYFEEIQDVELSDRY